MWKRLNNPKGARQPPPQLNTSADQRSYQAPSGLGIITPIQSPPERTGPPPRPPREDMAPKTLPRLPFEPDDLTPPPQVRDSTFRPVSSIYSQPSPNAPTSRFPRNSYAYPSTSYPEEEVSPPSSPEFDGRYNRSQYRNHQDEEVSPIDEMPDVSRLGVRAPEPIRPSSGEDRPSSGSRAAASSIPVLRREKKRNQISAAATNLVTRKQVGGETKGRKTVDPRWDPYSGEITTSEKGKPQSVKPGAFVPPGLRQVHKETGIVLGNESSISAGSKNHSSFGERVRKLKLNNSTPQERPEWKGAMGRTALISPVADNLDIPPISIPPKSTKRVASPPVSASNTPVVRYREDETHPATTLDPTIRTVLSNSGRNSPQVTQSPITITEDPFIVNQSAAARTLARGNTLPVEVPNTRFPKDHSVGNIERNFREALKGVSLPAGESDPCEQPPSRFSVTTYAPSEAQSTPRPSGEPFEQPPPMPTSAQRAEQQSILDRKRPKVGGTPQSAVPRKAVNVNPGSPIFISMTSSIASKRSSNTAKNLPMSPAEAQSHDLVTALQAQLDDLAHRRNNITKSIKQMTELMPKDSVIVTEEVRRKRELEKLKVEQLRIEEADVRREEHDIGLRLHRAWKRRDKDAVYEPTGLWVRRVTG